MKRSTTVLKGVVILLSLSFFFLASLGFIWLLIHPADPNYDQILYPIIGGLYLSCLPYFYALKQAYSILKYIELNEVFSEKAIIYLKRMKNSMLVFAGIYLLVLPFVYWLAEVDDAPGLILVGVLPIFASIVIAAFLAVLQELLKKQSI